MSGKHLHHDEEKSTAQSKSETKNHQNLQQVTYLENMSKSTVLAEPEKGSVTGPAAGLTTLFSSQSDN